MKYTEPMRLVAGLVVLAAVVMLPLPGQVPKEMDAAAVCRLITVDEAAAILGAGAAQIRTKENCEYQAQVPGSNIPLRLVGGVFIHTSAESAGKMYEMLKKAAEGKERNEATLGPRAFSVEKFAESSLQFVAVKGNKCLTVALSWPHGAAPPAAEKARPLVKKALSRLQ